MNQSFCNIKLNVKSIFTFITLFLYLYTESFSQQGNGYLTNFSTAAYKGSDQNWDAVEDSVGKMYFANLSGVLVYDGKFWKTIKLPNEASVFSLDIDKNGKVFVGGENEFGFIEPDSMGALRYKSLSDKLAPPDKDFSKTWATHCIDNDVFFCSNEKLFWYHDHQLKTFNPGESGFHTFFKVGNHLFVREFDKGFQVFENGKLNFIEGSEEFADKRVYSVLNLQGNTYIVATRNNGIYLLYYNDKNPSKSVFVKRNTLIDQWLIEKELYCGTKIGENQFAFGSLKDGIIVTDRTFRVVAKLNSYNGLQDDAVKNIYMDVNHNLWLSLNFGITFYEYNTPITFWKKNDGIKGVVENVTKFNGRIYVATDKGLLKYNNDIGRFEPTPIEISSFACIVADHQLFIGTQDGLYSYDGIKYNLLLEETVYSLCYDSLKNHLFIGTENNLYKTLIKSNQVQILDSISDVGEVRFIAVDKNNNAAAATADNGVYVLKDNKHRFFIGIKEGLPVLNDSYVFTYQKELFVATDKGFYKLDINHEKVFPMNSMNNFSARTMVSASKQINNEIWFQSTKLDKIKDRIEEIISIEPRGNEFVVKQSFLNRIQGANAKQFFYSDGKIYIGTNQGLFCYDINKKVEKIKINAVVSRATLGTDTVNFLENYSANNFFLPTPVSYKNNELHVYPAATSFFGADFMEFSYYLEGYETSFREWVTTNNIPYNNIHEGTYVFHLKARDLLGNESKEVSFSFTISPPWYRTTLAYSLYVIFLIGGIIVFVSLYTRHLKQKNINLENIITQRTQTIVDQKKELEHKNQEITDSINYAKRIQLAILPEVRSIRQQWNDVFVFYQPKDIVSGDFYWYKKINEHEFLIAVADCTGHGVPGGFMSMICSDKLHQAAEISTQPDIVLFHANNYIKDTLKQGNIEGGTKDGMEISLIKINTQTHQVQYAGANRFLWLIRKGAHMIEEIKPTKASIASTTDFNFIYQLHELQLAKNDLIYMSSDGYPDQFGGPNGKKFMTKNFKDFIFSIHHQPLDEQEYALRKNINDWMHGYEQVDDLLVIGVKL